MALITYSLIKISLHGEFMTKNDLAIEVSKKTDISQVKALEIVSAVMESMRESLERNESVILRGFGTFIPVTSAPRSGRNMRTTERVIIPAKNRVKFHSYMDEKAV